MSLGRRVTTYFSPPAWRAKARNALPLRSFRKNLGSVALATAVTSPTSRPAVDRKVMTRRGRSSEKAVRSRATRGYTASRTAALSGPPASSATRRK
uniref:Umc2266 n=1 Tax=Arundo donax TaxID=35708 RepID=A0A0A9GQI8_ARUDO